MWKPFAVSGNSLPDYKSSKPLETPFTRGSHAWDERQGALIIQRRNWQIACGTVMIFCFMLLGWVVYREVYEPLPAFAVPVDSSGLAVGGGVKMGNMRYEPTRAQVAADIAKWVVLIRSRPSDGFALRQNLMTAEVFMDTAGIELWNGYKAKADPFENYRTSSDQSSRVTIIVSGPTDNLIKDIATFPVVTQNEGNSYTANWRETRWEMGSSITYQMTSTVHAKSTPQKDERKITINPGGTAISWFDWRGKPVGQ